MFTVAEPALALNDVRVGGRIHMSRSIRIHPDDSRENILGCVATVASQAPEGRLKSLVLNSHGVPGYLVMGEGFWQPHTSLFERWAGLVDNIWITACEIASRIPLPKGLILPKGWKGQAGDGFLFCREVARRTRSNVIASVSMQDVPNSRIPNGSIDSFEGTVLCFRSTGDVAWSHKYQLHNSE